MYKYLLGFNSAKKTLAWLVLIQSMIIIILSGCSGSSFKNNSIVSGENGVSSNKAAKSSNGVSNGEVSETQLLSIDKIDKAKKIIPDTHEKEVNAVTWKYAKAAPAWSDIICSHYKTYNTPGGYPLFRMLRGPGTASVRPDMNIDVTDAKGKRPNDVLEVIGAFSGEKRCYDFGSENRAGSFTNMILKNFKMGAGGLLTIAPGGPGKGGSPQNWDLIKSKNAEYFKDFVYQLAIYVNTGVFKDQPIINFEIGNEVNSCVHFDPSGRADTANVRFDYANDDIQANTYVELFFSPAVEAIRKASQDLYGDPERFKIALGGIATLQNPEAHAFIEKVMQMNMNPQTAPSLAGKQVKDYVDIMAVHYVMVVKQQPNKYAWNESIERLVKTWVDTGICETLWHTEEHGSRGYGAFHILVSGFRYFNWWSEKGWDFTNLPKIFWWGADKKTDALNVQMMLVDLWEGGRSPLTEISGHLDWDEAASLEGYALSNSTGPDMKSAIVFFSKLPDEQPSGQFKQFSLHSVPDNLDLKNLQVKAYIVNASTEEADGKPMEMIDISLEYKQAEDRMIFSLSQDLTLSSTQALLTIIQPSK